MPRSIYSTQKGPLDSHKSEIEGNKDVFMHTELAQITEPLHATTHCLQRTVSLRLERTRDGQRARGKGGEAMAWLARARRTRSSGAMVASKDTDFAAVW